MKRRERVMAAVDRRKPDVVPVGFKATDDVLAKFKEHFGVDDTKGILAALPVDTYGTFNNCYNGIEPIYVGGPKKVLYPDTYPDGTWDSIYGYKRRWVPYGAGHNDEVITHPLAEAQTIEDLDRHEWPRADWFDFSTIGQQCRDVGDYAIIYNLGGLGHAVNLIGGQRHFMDMALNPEFVETYHAKITDFYVEFTDRLLAAADGMIDIVCMQDDFGAQRGPMISLEMFRRLHKPCLKRVFDVAHRHDVKAMMHSCGASFDFIGDFIEMGTDILDPIQTTAEGMEPVRLKREFGNAISFHGGIDTQRILVKGGPDDVRRHIDELIEGFDGAGYILAPAHYIQADAPFENVLAIFEHISALRT